MTSRKTVTCHQIMLITGLPRSGRVCKTVYVFTTTSTRSDARKSVHTYRSKERAFSNQLCSEETVQHGKSQTKKCRCNTKISRTFLIARSFLENFVDYIHAKRSKQHIVVGLSHSTDHDACVFQYLYHLLGFHDRTCMCCCCSSD